MTAGCTRGEERLYRAVAVAGTREGSPATGVEGGGDGLSPVEGQTVNGVERGRPSRQLDHYYLARPVHEDVLAVDPGSVEEGHCGLGHPPAVSVVHARRVAQRLLGGYERFRAVGRAGDDVANPRLRHHRPLGLAPPTGPATLACMVWLAGLGKNEPESADVAKRRAESAVCHGVAVRIGRDLRVVLRAHRLPYEPRYEVMQACA